MLKQPKRTLFNSNLKMAEAPLECVNIKIWESGNHKSGGETSSAALQPWRGFLFLPLLSCLFLRNSSPVAFKGSAHSSLAWYNAFTPTSLRLFLYAPSPRDVYAFTVKWIFQHQSAVFASLQNRFLQGCYGAECSVRRFVLFLFFCHNGLCLTLCPNTLIRGKHISIRGITAKSQLPFSSLSPQVLHSYLSLFFCTSA